MAQTISTFSKRIPPGVAGAGTLQALMERQQQAARQKEAAGAGLGPITSPWQGAAHIGNIVAAGINEGRASKQQDEARQALAQVVAGIDPNVGASKEQLAEMEYIDPVLAKQYRDEAFAARRSADERKYQTGERLAGQDFEITKLGKADEIADTNRTQDDIVGDENERVKAETAAGVAAEDARVKQLQAEQNAALQVPTAQREAAVKLGRMTPEAKAAADKAEVEKAAADAANAQRTAGDAYSPTGDIENDYNNGVYGPAGSERAIRLRDEALAAENLKGTPTPAAGSDYAKKAEQTAAERHGKIIEEGNAAPAFMSDIRRIADLGKQIGTGKWAQIKNAVGPYIEMSGVDLDNLGEMQAYEALIAKTAPNMRPANSGSTSNFDASQFLRSLSSLGNDPQGNQIIEATFQALEQHKINAAALAARAMLPTDDPNYLSWQVVDSKIAALPYPYDLFNDYMKKRPAPGGGGGLQVEPIEVP